MWHLNSVHINFSLNPFPASMASVMDPIWFTWPHVNLKYNWTSNCQSHYFNEWKLSTFCVIFPCLQQERIASSDFQGLHSSEELFRTCHLCLFYRWIFIHVFHTLSKRTFLQLWYELHCSTTNTQVTFHSVISIHFSWFFSTKQCCHSGPTKDHKEPSWLEWGWSPANHRPQSGPFDPPETSMVRTNSSAARSFANACWCHDDIYKYAWIPYVEREWMRCIFCNSFSLIFPSCWMFNVCLRLPLIIDRLIAFSLPSACSFK